MASPVNLRAIIADDEPLARERVRHLLRSHPDIEVVAEGIETNQQADALLAADSGFDRASAGGALLYRHQPRYGETLPIVDGNGKLTGLITVKDFVKTEQHPNATKDSDGRLLVGGDFTTINGGAAIRLARLSATGVLDTGFAAAGGHGGSVRTLALQSDGKIIVAGTSIGISSEFSVSRLNVDGSLDATFGVGGTATIGSQDDGLARAVKVQSDGKIVVAGTVLVRYNADGSLDTTFGTGGRVTTDAGLASVLTQADGTILIPEVLRKYMGMDRIGGTPAI